MKTLLKITHNILFKLKCILNILYTYIKSASVAKELNVNMHGNDRHFLPILSILQSEQPQPSMIRYLRNFEAAAMT